MLSHLYGPTLTSVHDWWKNHSFDYTYLCSQSDVSAFEYTVWLCHSFPSKEQVSLNFIPAVTVCSDFGTQENKTCRCFHFFPFYLPWSERPDAMNRFLMFSFKLAFAPSFFTFIKRLYSTCSILLLEWYHWHIWGCWYFSWQSWFQFVIHPAQHFARYTLHIS